MDKIVLGFALVLFAFSCGNKKEKTEEEFISTDAPVEATDLGEPNVLLEKGEELIAASDCLACHKVDEKVVGPSYKDVAAKYTEKDVTMLTEKIIKGGQGVWGEVPMTPHPALTTEDATEMVNYILTLK